MKNKKAKALFIIGVLAIGLYVGYTDNKYDALQEKYESSQELVEQYKKDKEKLAKENKKLNKTVKEYEDAFDSNDSIKEYVIAKIKLLTEDYYNERISKIEETIDSLEKESDDLEKEIEKNEKEISKLEEGETLSYTFSSGFYQGGTDYEEGYYHIVALSGGGNVIDEYNLNEIMGPSNDGFYKKECDSTVSGELQVSGVTIKMTGKSATISEENQNKIDNLEETNNDLKSKLNKKQEDISSFEEQQEELEKLRDKKY